jgi:hypothetical protein
MHDEIDNVFRLNTADPTNATLLAVFNQGYTPSATVPRCVGQGTTFKVMQMPCYCAVAFAGLKKLPDTLESRTIKIRMKRRANDEVKESFRRRRHVQEAEPICGALAGWCAKYQARCWRPNRRTALFLALTLEMDAMACAGCRAKQLEGLIGLLQKRLDEAGHKGGRHVH